MQTAKQRVALLLGSENDLSLVQPAIKALAELEIPYSVRILSAHRLGDEACQFASDARSEGFGVLIAAAGKAAHLAGTLASRTLLPVIGLPLSASLGGLDALLSTVQMPSGYPVATVAIDGAANAALLAAQILALSDSELLVRLDERRKAGQEAVREADRRIAKSFM
ncbi:MAG: 5-(carboxyamino)imidazole ribonucleotide mutase [Sphaerochaeta sp.]|jgi:5-(carboxyamino)imidazole ribonucleotide mutase|uniref:N5-carboxyaminoimidazole ribonucleotide mutase n=2 Tax=root TaxID=1 RepID=A0ABY4D8K6_9SPIR|nr:MULTISPECIES: 5-(carboxyamino)imidazole ribonucleotide mutase [Sphaerochaeta]MDT3359544.1 5-(carboxyamino)imidazole ribonucleotide mutase [Spirochaetota bacterium]NLA98253.1 5-(carboxyamino)imidazole ribonucleotide mutase [Spirochaetales bacterium]MDD2394334.1 5-(carboxyamino)imidazole ribonucleotide mutase [Sphaerochaeta sp.]MDD3423303.1 5-(carboxyamino)imidazole ribonucleotide mutase [Sphaerochaeta sp.]MDD4037871.1 5-(carboxyamino)imidazole ribonucleotide mutase [Sphaerochaeta sp.]